MLSGSLLVACGRSDIDSETLPPVKNTITETPNQLNEVPPMNLKTQYADNKYGTKLEKINEKATKRASMETEYGKLYIISNGKEEISRFEAPTSYGAEGDYAFRGNYDLILEKDGDKKVIMELTDFSFVQPSENPVITFDKIPFETIDLFLVTPEYIGSRGDNSYAIAVNKETGNAFQVTFKRQDVERKYLNYEESKPRNKNEILVIQTRNSEKISELQQGLQTVEYVFDEAKNMFVANE